MIWHGDPNAFPDVAQIHYGNGPVYPSSYPPQSMAWGPMPPPTPDSSLISTQGFVPSHDPSFPVAQYQPRPATQDGEFSIPGKDVPRVMPTPISREIDLLKLGQWQGQAVPVPLPGPGAPANGTGKDQVIETRPVVESTVRALDLLTQPMTSPEPSYILSGKGQELDISEESTEEASIVDDIATHSSIFDEIVKDQSKSSDISESNEGSSTSRGATNSLEPSPLIFSSFIASTDRNRKKIAKGRTPVKRFLAATKTVQTQKKRPRKDGTTKPPNPSCTAGAIRSSATSMAIINLENDTAGSVGQATQGSTPPNGDPEEVDYLRPLPSSPNWEAEMNGLFDFDGASLCWRDESFWENEDPGQTGQHGCPGHPMKIFRGTIRAPFSLDPWVDDELLIPLWAI